jgi:multidrug efflux system membrane fusion protein
VSVATAEKADVPVDWRGVGTVEALSSVAVRSQVGGTLLAVHFKEGQEVRKGDLLFTIDPRQFEAALHTAEAQLARDQALADNAAATAERYADLAKREFVTAEEYEARRSNAAALKATLEAGRAEVERARLDLGYCRIVSPISGRTGSLRLFAGNLVKANDDNALVDIQQMAPIRVAFSVPQALLAEVRRRASEGTPEVVVTSPGDSVSHTGALTFVDNAVDPGSGTIALKATFENEDRALWPGEFVQVTLTLSRLAGAIVAPSVAVQAGQQGSYVYVVEADGSAAIRPVELGPIVGDRTVLKSGVEAGETLVTDGQLRLYPGAKVEVLTASADPNAAPAATEHPAGGAGK